MPVVQKDDLGIYIDVGGHRARPCRQSSLKEGDKVQVKQLASSCSIGLERFAGLYSFQELWKTQEFFETEALSGRKYINGELV